jgi:hypothetical protein
LKPRGQVWHNTEHIPEKVQTNSAGTANKHADKNPLDRSTFEKNINWNTGTHNHERKQNCNMKPDQREPCAFE